MNLMTKEEMKALILDAEGFEIQNETTTGIEVYDNQEDKFFNYHYLEGLDLKKLFQFNSLNVNKESFFKVVEDCFDKHMFMVVDKIVFINNEAEYDELIEEYPEQFMDLENAVGINFLADNVVVVNAMLLHQLAEMQADEILSFEKEYAKGLWETLVHELRHNITDNPIIPESMIAIEEGAEDAVEAYCREIYDTKISKHPNELCFEKVS